jgi:WD40-like Beta Propeller Repeat
VKRFWRTLAVALAAIFASAGCGGTNTTFQPNTGATLTFLAPADATAGGGDFTLIVNGSGFVAKTVVQWNGSNRTTTFVSLTQVTAAIKAADISTAGRMFVQTMNPPTSSTDNGLSNALAFIIHPAAASASGSTATAAVDSPAISADGRFVAYTGASGEHTQIFLHDGCGGADKGCQARTDLISAAEDGTAGDADSRSPSISADGRFVAFSSAAGNLLKDSPAGRQIFLRDTCLGADASCKPATQLISTDPGGALSGAENLLPSISSSGRFVAFLSVMPSPAAASNAAQGAAQPNSGFRQVFVRDTCFAAANCTPRTMRISLQPGDAPAPADGTGTPQKPALSGDGSRVALAGRDATLFTSGKAIDDSVFLAATRPR